MPLVLVHKAVRAPKRRPEWQDTTPPEPELRDAYAIAARHETAFSRAFLRFTRDLMSPEAMRGIRRALRNDTPEDAVRSLPMLEASDKMRESFERAYAEIIQEAGQATANENKWRLQFEVEKRVEVRFGGVVPINPFSLAWLRLFSSKRIREIGEQQEANVRNVIFRGFKQGRRGPKILEQIEQEVGLLEREQRAVERRFQTALDAGIPEPIANRQRERYAMALLRKRAKRISRTETIEAQAQGRNDAWALAREQGLVTPELTREWIAATASDRTCPICIDLDGQRADIGEPYYSNVLGRAIMRPVAHVSCRCSEILVDRESEPHKRIDPTPLPAKPKRKAKARRKAKTRRKPQPKAKPIKPEIPLPPPRSRRRPPAPKPGPKGGLRITDWDRRPDGSWRTTAATGESIELVRRKRRWFLVVDGKDVKDLGTRATLDHAEGALLTL